MQTRPRHARRPDLWAITLLAALLFRAYIPVGFMPASGTPFLLELCPAFAGASGTPAHHQHHQHSPAHSDFQNCPFGNAPAMGPVSHYIAFELPGRMASSSNDFFESQRLVIRPLRAHQPRGPPSLA